MAAVVQVQINTSTGPTVGSAEGGVNFLLEDSVNNTSPTSGQKIQVPTATGTNFSYVKTFHLQVTSGGGSTSILNRKLSLSGAPATGVTVGYKDGSTTYAQATAAPTASGSNGAVPSTYTALTTTPQTWDAASNAATNSTRNGNFVLVAVGLDATYAGGAGNTNSLPTLQFQYDEA